MEVDLPQMNGLPEGISNGTRANGQKVVQFSDMDDVRVFNEEISMRPKQKAARRVRMPPAALAPLIDFAGTGGDALPPSPRKPQSPSKLKKMAEKDRHSRTGRRGLPKKGGW